jgi:hypothetical protein
MRQRWERLTFLHWPFEPAAVQALLPPGLRAETFDGAAWVGLVPFYMHVATGAGRTAPWVSHFAETNVRTYVRDEQDRPGIWFFSLDAARLGAVAVARTTYGLPYYWANMRVRVSRDGARYGSSRRWPGPAGASSRVHIRIGASIEAGEVSERDHFLTARWMLFSKAGEGTRRARAEHAPWPLHRAEVDFVSDQLVRAAGLPLPDREPLVLYSPGVDVRISRPE